MRRWAAGLVLAAMTLGLMAQTGRAAELELAAPSSILMEKTTGEVLYEDNADEKLRPASVTKVMTLLLVMEALEDGRIGWDDMVTTSAAAAAKGGSQIYLEENEQLPLTEMLKSVVVSSANDCACALAEHIAGSEAAFVQRMNERAQELGMANTHFVNCTGLDDGPDANEHLTTARDIAIMSRELLKHEKIKEYTTIWMDTVRGGKFGLANTNKLVRFYDGTTGLKTGSTNAAGYCISATAEREGMELIAVVLKSPTGQQRFEDAKALLNYGFSTYALLHTVPEEPFPAIPVVLGETETVQPCIDPQEAVALLQKSQAGGLSQSVTLAEQVEAPVSTGQELGTLTLTDAAGETVQSIPIRAAQSVERLTFGTMLRRMLSAAFFAG